MTTPGSIGLGVMGAPMVRNLMAAGDDVVMHKRTAAARRADGRRRRAPRRVGEQP